MGTIVTISARVEPAAPWESALTKITDIMLAFILMMIWQRIKQSEQVVMMVMAQGFRQSSTLNMEIIFAMGAVEGETSAKFTTCIARELTIFIWRGGESKRVFGVRLVFDFLGKFKAQVVEVKVALGLGAFVSRSS